jgi:undecaprenyl diphosphate synthase
VNAVVPGTSPQHVAIIMDGNGRWAKRRLLPRHAGHKAGLTAARKIIEHCVRRSIPALTLFTFSSENWKRPEGEVSRLMDLFLGALGKDVQELHQNGVRVRFIGARDAFSPGLQRGMQDAEQLTGDNHKLTLNMAVGYGGRWEIVEAARRCMQDAVAGVLKPEALDEAGFSAALCLHPDADPDLFIRTGGEKRISNFLLWQLAYSELYFTDVLWPDFDEQAFDAALQWFAQRERRFGLTGEQLQGQLDA